MTDACYLFSDLCSYWQPLALALAFLVWWLIGGTLIMFLESRLGLHPTRKPVQYRLAILLWPLTVLLAIFWRKP